MLKRQIEDVRYSSADKRRDNTVIDVQAQPLKVKRSFKIMEKLRRLHRSYIRMADFCEWGRVVNPKSDMFKDT